MKSVAKQIDKEIQQNNPKEGEMCVVASWIAKEIMGWGSADCLLLDQQMSICSYWVQTPMQMWSDHNEDYSRLGVFGCVAYAHIRRDKLLHRTLRCIFLGHLEGKGLQAVMFRKKREKYIHQLRCELQWGGFSFQEVWKSRHMWMWLTSGRGGAWSRKNL